MITLDQLHQTLHYDPVTGVFIWREKRRPRIKAGDTAGNLDKKGYRVIMIFGKEYRAHRLAWFYMTGEWPSDQIDHRDKNKSNNIFTNLREADNAQNVHNTIGYKNKTGYRGVFYYKKYDKFYAFISINKKRIYLGSFDTSTEASIAYQNAAKENMGEFYYKKY